MPYRTTVALTGVFLLVLQFSLPGTIYAWELPRKPGDPVAIPDLRQTTVAYDRVWIEKVHTIYSDRNSGSLDPGYIFLALVTAILLGICVRLGAKMNGLDRHLAAFADHQFKTALSLWMVRRWGARI